MNRNNAVPGAQARRTAWLRFKPAVILLSWVLVAGCADQPARSDRPSTDLSETYAQHQEGDQEARRPVTERWWEKYRDAELTALVEHALKANQDVLIAMTRLDEAKSAVDAQTARFLPSLSLGAAALDSASGLPAPVKQGMPDIKARQLNLNLNWEIDLSGRVRSARSAAQADSIAAINGINGVRLMVAAEVAREYFTLRGAEQRYRELEALVQLQRERTTLIAQRQSEGYASALSLTQAQAALQELESQLPSMRTEMGSAAHTLARLVGNNPSLPPVQPDSAWRWPDLQPVASGQPADLLRRRPDLLTAEARYSAQSYREDESKALLWPQIFLSALLGREGLTLNSNTYSPVRYSSVAAALVVPVLNRGQLQANIDAQSARRRETLLLWQQATLVAVEEVENSLLALHEANLRTANILAAESAQQKSVAMVQALQQEGQTDRLTLISTQQALLAEQITLSATQLQATLSDVQLIKALGGGWEQPAASPIALTTPYPATPTSLHGVQP